MSDPNGNLPSTEAHTPPPSPPAAPPTAEQIAREQERQREQREDERRMADETRILESELKRARDEAAAERTARVAAEKEVTNLQGLLKAAETNLQAATEEGKGLKSIAKERDDWKTKYEQQAEAVRTELVNRLPEDKREKFGALDTEALRLVVDEITATSAAPAQSAETGVAGAAPTAESILSQMSTGAMPMEQLMQIADTNPSLYQEVMMKQMNG